MFLPGNSLLSRQTSPLKMAAAMDVDTPSGTNSGASKKRFEVKKVMLYELTHGCGVRRLYDQSAAQ